MTETLFCGLPCKAYWQALASNTSSLESFVGQYEVALVHGGVAGNAVFVELRRHTVDRHGVALGLLIEIGDNHRLEQRLGEDTCLRLGIGIVRWRASPACRRRWVLINGLSPSSEPSKTWASKKFLPSLAISWMMPTYIQSESGSG